jgi:hypothetical protein
MDFSAVRATPRSVGRVVERCERIMSDMSFQNRFL